jgi:hypothetical protein
MKKNSRTAKSQSAKKQLVKTASSHTERRVAFPIEVRAKASARQPFSRVLRFVLERSC